MRTNKQPVRVEEVPPPRAGYVWAPGFWEWRGGRHVWVGGHWIGERRGYHWVPDRWEQRGRTGTASEAIGNGRGGNAARPGGAPFRRPAP